MTLREQVDARLQAYRRLEPSACLPEGFFEMVHEVARERGRVPAIHELATLRSSYETTVSMVITAVQRDLHEPCLACTDDEPCSACLERSRIVGEIQGAFLDRGTTVKRLRVG